MSSLKPIAPADCVFCRILTGKPLPTDHVPEVKLNDFGDTAAFEPLDPVTPGHLLVVPVTHVADAAVDPAITGRTAEYAARLGSLMLGNNFNLITSVGRHASQTVAHLHWHIVPRVEDDGLHLPWTGQKRSHA